MGYTNESDVSNFPLNSIVQCPFDHSFLCFAVRLFGDDIEQKDKNGNLPLHIACGSSLNNESSANSISLLLDAYPKGAKMCDGRGEFPLHLAVASGKIWDEGVDKIFAANQRAINYRDRKQHLYPFL